jgi:spectinomycin phosphotransferase
VEDLPAGLTDHDLATGLARFGITEQPTYVPVGFGDYHWAVADRWFTSVSDLTQKSLTDLRRAMNTAGVLRLPFVVAPLKAGNGDVVVQLNDRYALCVFPFVAGKSGSFGDEVTAADRDEVLTLLAALHEHEPPEAVPVAEVDPPNRTALEALLDDPGDWFSTPAREAFVANRDLIRDLLAEFDSLAAQTSARLVVTHGEPHPGNLIRTEDGFRLIDWDTVALAAPERDLSLFDDHTAYTNLTGYEPVAAGLALYKLRWSLNDIADYAVWLRAPHEQSRDAELTLHYFTTTLDSF